MSIKSDMRLPQKLEKFYLEDMLWNGGVLLTYKIILESPIFR